MLKNDILVRTYALARRVGWLVFTRYEDYFIIAGIPRTLKFLESTPEYVDHSGPADCQPPAVFVHLEWYV